MMPCSRNIHPIFLSPSLRLSKIFQPNCGVLKQTVLCHSRSLNVSNTVKNSKNIAKYKYYDQVVEGSYISTDTSERQPVQAPDPVFVFEGSAAHSDDPLDRAKTIFGGRLAGEKTKSDLSSSRYTSHNDKVYNIAGVLVPEVRPKEPDNCCMSGCVNCVWELYNEDLGYYKQQRRLAAKALIKKGGVWPLELNPPVRLLPNENLPKELHKKDNTAPSDQDEDNGNLRWESVSMSVFADLEKKIKNKHKNTTV